MVLVAGACHLAISAIPRWINTCTMKPATEAGEAKIYSWRENDEKTQARTINKRPPNFKRMLLNNNTSLLTSDYSLVFNRTPGAFVCMGYDTLTNRHKVPY